MNKAIILIFLFPLCSQIIAKMYIVEKKGENENRRKKTEMGEDFFLKPENDDICPMENNYAYYSNNIPSGKIKSATIKTARECQKVCTNNPECKYFTWFKDILDMYNPYRCYLKSSKIGRSKAWGYTSGSA